MSVSQPDLIIVGAGLSGLMTAWRCLSVNEDAQIVIIEASKRIGGDHTWSFNLSDIEKNLQDWLDPFIAHNWPKYDVRFPKYTRTLDIPYCTGHSNSLRACVQPFIDEGRLHIRLNTPVKSIKAGKVELETGDVLSAPYALDARGFEDNEDVFLGYQKFVGHVIKTPTPHGLKNPIIMDATVKQLGGYRFVYCLPYSETEMLVEDTYYTDGAELKSQEVDARIKAYIRDNLNINEYSLTRSEKGVLPITLAVNYKAGTPLDKNWPAAPNRIGIAGGFYHAVTGYSLPNAVKIADEIAQALKTHTGKDPESREPFSNTFIRMAQREHLQNERFFRLLNRMLFRAAEPQERYKVLQRFYTLSEGLVRRFYAGTLTPFDKIRVLSGKPPVPIHKALKSFSETAFIRRERQRRKSDNE